MKAPAPFVLAALSSLEQRGDADANGDERAGLGGKDDGDLSGGRDLRRQDEAIAALGNAAEHAIESLITGV